MGVYKITQKPTFELRVTADEIEALREAFTAEYHNTVLDLRRLELRTLENVIRLIRAEEVAKTQDTDISLPLPNVDVVRQLLDIVEDRIIETDEGKMLSNYLLAAENAMDDEENQQMIVQELSF